VTLKVEINGNVFVREIKDFNLIGNKIQISIPKETVTTVTETMWKRSELRETHYEEDSVKLGKGVIVEITKNKKVIFEHGKRKEEEKNECITD
jgi:hypothetical protein